MLRTFLKSKIHRARVTRADLDYEGSIAMDQLLIDAAELLPFEKVEIYNVASGTRWETYVIPTEKGTGEICVNGAAARLCQPNDLIIICCYVQLNEKEVDQHRAIVVRVDENNQVVGTIEKSVIYSLSHA